MSRMWRGLFISILIHTVLIYTGLIYTGLIRTVGFGLPARSIELSRGPSQVALAMQVATQVSDDRPHARHLHRAGPTRVSVESVSVGPTVARDLPVTQALDSLPWMANFAPSPVYPAIALRLHQQGLVELLVKIDRSGNAVDVRVQKTAGFQALDEAATQAIKRWRFIAQANTVVVPVRFRLDRI